MAKEAKFNIQLNVDGKEVVVGVKNGIRELGKELGTIPSKSEQARSVLMKLGAVSTAIGGLRDGFSQLSDMARQLAGAYRVQEEAELKLDTIMRQRMSATDSEVDSIKQLASEQQRLGVIGDEVQLAGAQQVATFLSEKSSIEQLLPAMNNLAVQRKGLNVTAEDMVNIGNLVGKVMQGNVGALTRVGITFTEAEKQALKYGDEEQRAAMLAQIITNNVGEMNQKLAQTDAGKAKQMANGFGDMQEKIGEAVAKYEPFLQLSSQIGMTVAGIGQIVTGFTAMARAIGLATLAQRAFNATWQWAKLTFSMKTAKLAVVEFTTAQTLCGKSALAAAASTTLFKNAIRGLLVASGIGAILVGLSFAFDAVTRAASGSSEAVDAATDSTKGVADISDMARKQVASQVAAYQQATIAAKNFKGSKEEEHKAVASLNSTYGDTLGTYSSLSDWYKTLTDNSEAYTSQLLAQAKMQILANKAAEKELELKDLEHEHPELNPKNSNKISATLPYNPQEQIDMPSGVPQNPQLKADNLRVFTDKSGKTVMGTLSQYHDRLKEETADYRRQMQEVQDEAGKITYKKTNQSNQSNQSNQTNRPNQPNRSEQPSPAGSLDWYEKRMQELRRQITATASETEAKTMQQQYDRIEAEANELKVRIGMEKPEPEEARTYVEQLQDQLSAAQKEMDNALTVEARVKASAKISDLQQQIDTATAGELTIPATAEPRYVTKGSEQDKVLSYQNAQQKGSQIQDLFDAGIIDGTEAHRRINDINKQLSQLGENVKPIKLQVETEDATQKLKTATDAVEQMGGAINSLGSSIGVPELNIAGTLAQAIATMIQGYAEATKMAASMGPWAWVAFAATGLVQVAAMVSAAKSAVGGYATGGIVGGSDYTGDRVVAHVNSGEMILNQRQQARLFAIADGSALPRVAIAARQAVVPMPAAAVAGSALMGGEVTVRLRGRDLVGALANETRIGSRSGRRSNIVI